MTTLVVVESGAKAKTIQKYLGKGYVVEACRGHVEDLPYTGKDKSKAEWASRKNDLPAPPWDWTPGGKKIFSGLRKRINTKGVDLVLIATDPDREGEFIAWRLEEHFKKIEGVGVGRITFQEITKSALSQAMSQPGSVDMDLVDAAQVRRFMDRLIGFRCSRFSRSWYLQSMGRVQTPTLGFLVEREKKIQAFVPTPYFKVDVQAGDFSFGVRFHDENDTHAWRDEKGKFNKSRTSDGKEARGVYETLSQGGAVEVFSEKTTEKRRSPPLPFTTDTLLGAAGSRLGWSPGRTMKAAQSLYEQGHITYLRTDSTRTSPVARKSIRKVVEKRWGKNHLGVGATTGKKGGGKVQDAHEAIRPTRPASSPSLSGDGEKLYALVWGQFAASQMAPSVWKTVSLVGLVKGVSQKLDATHSWQIFPGWEAAGRTAPLPLTPSPPPKGGDRLSILLSDDSPSFVEDKTRPPSRYSQHGLVARMKKEGIGRPSTYTPTIKKLLDRKYASLENRALRPTERAFVLIETVVPYFSNGASLFSSRFTAEMEGVLDDIEGGKQKAAPVWQSFRNHFSAINKSAQSARRSGPSTPRQRSALESRLKLTGKRGLDLLAGRDPSALGWEESSHLLESLAPQDGDAPPPASEKQIAALQRMAQRLNLSEEETTLLVDAQGWDDLTGGRKGTASALFDVLGKRLDENPPPASEKQIKYILGLAEKASMKPEGAFALVGAAKKEELTGGRKGSASQLIALLKKKVPKRRKGRKKK
ncbi:type I DNA topoisomerase [bacterium]|nr:type I DNA topoisomerase [bacterium]